MRKLLFIIPCILLFLFLAACSGGEQTVPSQMLDWAVEDYLEGTAPEGYTDRVCEAAHVPDRSTHTDAVTLDLTITYPHCTARTSYEAIYQYDKSADLWSVLRGGDWSPLLADSVYIPLSSEAWGPALEALGLDFRLYAEGPEDLEETLDDYSSIDLLDAAQTELYMESSDIFLDLIGFSDAESARALYEHMVPLFLGRNVGYTAGEDRGTIYTRYQDENSGNSILLIQAGTTAGILKVYLDDPDESSDRIDRLMQAVCLFQFP